MLHLLRRLVADDRGEDLIEYGLLIGVVTLGTISAINGIGCKVTNYFSTANSVLP